MDSISITVPMEGRALATMAGALITLAESMTPGIMKSSLIAAPILRSLAVDQVAAYPNIPLAQGDTGDLGGIAQTSIAPAGQEVESVPKKGPEVFTQAFPPAPKAPLTSPFTSDNNPPPPAGIELDTDGYPWDARIHSSNHEKVAGGTWRRKRNLDAAILTKVKAELRQAMSAPAALVSAPPVAADDPRFPPPPAAQQVPPPPPAPAAQLMSLGDLFKRVTAKGLKKEVCDAAAVSLGLPNFTLVSTRQDLIPALAMALGIL